MDGEIKTKLNQLSKEELLGLIYNNFGGETRADHPVRCAVCGRGTLPSDGDFVLLDGKAVEVLSYGCDECEQGPKEG